MLCTIIHIDIEYHGDLIRITYYPVSAIGQFSNKLVIGCNAWY